MDQLIINPSVRLIPHRQVDPGFFVYDALVMGKGLEAFLAVIASHTAFTEAAEWHFAGGEVNDHIIDTATAEATFRDPCKSCIWKNRSSAWQRRP